MQAHLRTLAFLPVAWLVACGSDDETGTVLVTAYGESYIEEGIASDDVEDGWEIEFSRFDVTFGEIVVAGEPLRPDAPLGLDEASDGQGHPLGEITAPAGDHGAPSFEIEAIDLSGSARRDDEEKRFDWRFETPTHYHDCDTSTSVPEGGEGVFQITVHADHLFYDSLVSDEPALRFQALADADTDGDGEITREELSDADLGAYDPGSSGDIDDLWAFLEAQARTVGHVDGEGHCETTVDP